jgi:hypothetical protein
MRPSGEVGWVPEKVRRWEVDGFGGVIFRDAASS